MKLLAQEHLEICIAQDMIQVIILVLQD